MMFGHREYRGEARASAPRQASVRYVAVTCEGADACEDFVDALMLLSRALDPTYSHVQYACKDGYLRAPHDVVRCMALRMKVLRETMEAVEEFCLEKGCNVVTPDRAHVDAAVFRRLLRRAVPLLLECVTHWCALYDMLVQCVRTCRARAGVCSVSSGPYARRMCSLQLEYVRRIQSGLRCARDHAAVAQSIAEDTVTALGSH
jgi:hypothetical protein